MTMKMIFCLPTIAAMSLLSSNVLAQDADDPFALEPAEEASPIYYNEIEVGGVWVSKGSYKFGEYTGLTDRGPFLTGNISMLKRDAWDSGTTNFWSIRGTDLGLSSRALAVEFGRQGSFKFHFDYDQIPKNQMDDARSPYISVNGGARLDLPAGWVPNNRDARTLLGLQGSVPTLLVTHERTKFGGGFTVNLNKHWTVKSEARRELKEGNRTIAGIFGSNGGNPGGALMSEPVDYRTDNYNVALGYSDKKAQFTLSYNLSQFRNNITTLAFQNVFDSTRWPTTLNVSYPAYGQMDLPPANQAHQLTFVGGYKVNNTTRITANLNYAKLTQDALFSAYTIDPAVAITIPMPRDSLEGELINTTARLAVTSRPTSKLNVRLAYRYQNRDNNTPRDTFVRIPNESATQGTIDGSNARINMPYSRKQHQIDATLGYRFNGDTKLALGYQYKKTDRDYQEVAKNTENKITAKLRARGSDKIRGWIGVDYSTRRGSDYIDNLPFLVSHAADHDPDEFENHPLVRKFFMANRDQFKVSGSASFDASDTVMFYLLGHYAKDDYKDTIIGLNESSNSSITLDASFQPNKELSGHAFITFEKYSYDQTGYGRRGGQPVDELEAKSWYLGTGDKIATVGLGLDYNPANQPVSFDVDYTYSSAVTDYGITAGADLSFEPLPDLTTKVHNIALRGDYEFSDNLTLRLRYLFEKTDTTDFALDGIDINSMQYIVGLGNLAPNYSVHVLGLSTVLRF